MNHGLLWRIVYETIDTKVSFSQFCDILRNDYSNSHLLPIYVVQYILQRYQCATILMIDEINQLTNEKIMESVIHTASVLTDTQVINGEKQFIHAILASTRWRELRQYEALSGRPMCVLPMKSFSQHTLDDIFENELDPHNSKYTKEDRCSHRF